MNQNRKAHVIVHHYWFEGRLSPVFAGMFLLAVFAGTCFARESEFPVTVLDCLGREVRVSAIPERIVSTVPSNTEILYDLGLEDKVVAVTSHCRLTCDVKGKKILNGWASVDIDEVVSLKPDLVLAFGGLQIPLVDELARRGVTTFSFWPRTVAETLYMLKIVGRITGTEQRAEQLVKSADLRLERIQSKLKKIPSQKRPTSLRLISPEDVLVAGRYSFQHDVLVQAGGNNIMEGLLHDYERVGFERIKALNPEVIILNGDDEQTVKQRFLNLEGWKDLPATQKGRIKVMPCRLICHPNFAIVDVVEMLARYLHPDLFGN